ncbi:hypothetical protein BAE44_0011181 [Dichanthelium oligosanthes]|uniref:Uncharacterized protein n=1 Tax=Dichanthelium oligosanthes TaxID=888268 RepID=A0A1E5VRS8_9POAL|nr:hypothetical protein BAE44_0011181 [Dichanthelium oligosanthes]
MPAVTAKGTVVTEWCMAASVPCISPSPSGSFEPDSFEHEEQQRRSAGVRHRRRRVHRLLAHEQAPRERLMPPSGTSVRPNAQLITQLATHFALTWESYPSSENLIAGDEEKAGLLRRLVSGAVESGRLVLFKADLYAAATFAPAIAGCRFVFLVAMPFQHDPTSTKYKSTAEAALDAARVILRQCAGSKTVKRVIRTGTMATCSPFREDSNGFKDAMDESCWTPLDADYPLRNAQFHVRSGGPAENFSFPRKQGKAASYDV